MKPNMARRLKIAVKIMMVCVPVSFTYEFIDTGMVSAIGVIIGIMLALPLVILEESRFDERVRRLPFAVAILTKVRPSRGSSRCIWIVSAWCRNTRRVFMWAR